MSKIFDFFTLLFDLSISPVWSFIIMAIIGAVAFVLAYAIAGKVGEGSGERTVIHWVCRVIIFILLWAIISGFIAAYKVIKEYPWLLYIVCGITIIIILLFVILNRKKNGGKRSVTSDESEQDRMG